MPREPIVECATKDCWAAPAVEAFIVLRARSHLRAVAPASLGLGFCKGCAAEISLADLVDDDVWKQIADGFEKSGRERPDRELAELDLVPLNSEV